MSRCEDKSFTINKNKKMTMFSLFSLAETCVDVFLIKCTAI